MAISHVEDFCIEWTLVMYVWDLIVSCHLATLTIKIARKDPPRLLDLGLHE